MKMAKPLDDDWRRPCSSTNYKERGLCVFFQALVSVCTIKTRNINKTKQQTDHELLILDLYFFFYPQFCRYAVHILCNSIKTVCRELYRCSVNKGTAVQIDRQLQNMEVRNSFILRLICFIFLFTAGHNEEDEVRGHCRPPLKVDSCPVV